MDKVLFLFSIVGKLNILFVLICFFKSAAKYGVIDTWKKMWNI